MNRRDPLGLCDDDSGFVESGGLGLTGAGMMAAGADVIPKTSWFAKWIMGRGFVQGNPNTSLASLLFRRLLGGVPAARGVGLPNATSLGGQLGRLTPQVGTALVVGEVLRLEWKYFYSYYFDPVKVQTIIENDMRENGYDPSDQGQQYDYFYDGFVGY